MSHPAVLLMLPSDTYKEGTSSNSVVSDEYDASSHQHGNISSDKQEVPTSHQDNSLLSNSVLNVLSSTSSLQSTPQFEGLPTWTPLLDGNGITSPTSDSDNELQEYVNDADVNEEPRKRQKTQARSTTGMDRVKNFNAPLAKSQDKKSTLIDGGSGGLRPPRLGNLNPSVVGSTDALAMHAMISQKTSLLTVENTKKGVKPSSTTSTIRTESSNPSSTDLSPTTVTKTKPRGISAKEESIISTRNRTRTNDLSGLLVSRRPMTSMSTSTSDSLKDYEESPKETRRLALRPTKSPYGTKLKKSHGRNADQNELERWTNADIAHIEFRKPDGPRLFDEAEEENAKKSVSHILAALMSSNENVARNGGTESNGVQNDQVAIPESSIYTRCDNLVEEIFGSDSRKRRSTLLKPKMGLVKQEQPLETSRELSNSDLPIITHSKVIITKISPGDEKEITVKPVPSTNDFVVSEVPTSINQGDIVPVLETREFQGSPSHASVSEDRHRLYFSDKIREGIPHSGKHQLFRRMQEIYSEDMTVLGKRTREGMVIGKTDMTVWYDMVVEDADDVEEEIDVDELEMDEDGRDRTPTTDELELSASSEWTKIVKNIQPVDGLEVATIEREQVEDPVERGSLAIDNQEDQEDEKMRNGDNSLGVPLPQLEEWSTTLRSLIKGKKKFQHQDLINLKNTLEAIYDNRANISATSSLAQEVYQVLRLGVEDVPDKDKLGLRTLARKSTRYWGIRMQRDA